jgi:eukaryotic-like serine/threonine-protein kinase
MPISIGTQLGSHEITALLGKGGMGEVYRARDLKLKREVAIKILPDEFSRDADRVSRFQREAEVLASLNHPNIAAIYDLQEANETRYLVLELVEGETLADRIARGPIPVEQALEIAKRICEAVEAAHEKGIIHRDLKPANVKITSDGKVKVLDFGLAKAAETVPANSTLSNSPTLSIAASGAGVILGTAAYMSPEQARGESTDARTDVFSFGCVLYEMLSGHHAFDGNTVSDILAGILRVEPNFAVLPTNLGPRVVEILRRCLEKNAKRRWHAVADLKMELEIAGADAYKPQTSPAFRSSKVWMTLGAVSLLAAMAMALVLVFNYRGPHESQMLRFLISAPDKTTFDSGVGGAAAGLTSLSAGSISPDGRKITFTARDEAGKVMLWVRPLDTIAARVFPGTEGAGLPFWSPDSKSIAFFSLGKLKKIDVEGGPPLTICDAGNPRGGTWNRDGVIVFATVQTGQFRVPAAGGEPTLVKQSGAGFPFFLPDGKHFLFARLTGDRAVFVGSLDSADTRQLTTADSAAVYASSGACSVCAPGNSAGAVI